MGEACSHLSEEERQVIRIEIGNGTSIRRIGLMLGRNASTVGREIKRNTWFPSNENESCRPYRPYRPKRLKTGPWTGRYYIPGPAAAQDRPQARQTAQALPPVMRTPVGAGGRTAASRLVAAARQRQAARPVPRRLRHARVPGDRLPLDPRRPPSP
ncbi:IS30 family transposase [Bifidobacterium longum subsp. infantis]|uniref:IS30 family transposase n=2 Tax=Bifidobacterium longum TaxID=216816 RepID=A0A0M4MD04_BIFLI|nr:IS30 family transposase [Bifidobacterium longum subsp. infantis]